MIRRLLPIIFLFGCSTGSHKRFDHLAELQKLTEGLNSLTTENGFTGWPGYKISDHSIIFLDWQNERAYLYRDKMLSPLPIDDEVKVFLSRHAMTYQMGTYQEQDTLVLSFDSSKEKFPMDALTYYALHEGFHLFWQNPKNKTFRQKSKQSSGRGQSYPVLSQPRYYRREMFEALNQYLESKDKKWLNRYSYWFFKWDKEFPVESKNIEDRNEGSAQYYTLQGLSFLDQKQSKTPLQWLRNSFFKTSFADIYNLDSESYILGVVAGLTLDELKVKNWKNNVDQGLSPLRILAQRSVGKSTPINTQLYQESQELAVSKMHEIDPDGHIDQMIADLASPKKVALAINVNKAPTQTFATKAFFQSYFNFAGTSNLMMIVLAAPLEMNTPYGKITLTEKDIWVSTAITPCQSDKSYYLFNIDPAHINWKKKELRVSQPFELRASEVKKVEVGNKNWICLN